MLETYVSIKVVQAEPQEKDGKPGYRVVYPDGYESWCPKEAWEQAACPVERWEDKGQMREFISTIIEAWPLVCQQAYQQAGAE